MPTLRIAVFIGLVFSAVLTACTSAPRVKCGPGLSEEAILQIAERAIQAIGGDPAELRGGHDIEILEVDCDYVLSAVPTGTAAVESISMRISRDGQVESFPWCCPLGSCPDLCTPPPPTSETPSGPDE